MKRACIGAVAVLALASLQGCGVATTVAVATTTTVASAAVSVTTAVVGAGITLTGKAVGAGIDALSSQPSQNDGSGIVVRERIRPDTVVAEETPAARAMHCAPAAGEIAAVPGATACP